MKEHVLRREQVLEAPLGQAFEFFSRAEHLEAITPPWLRFRITSPTPIEMHAGTLIRYRLALRGIPISWLTRIEEWEPPHRFVDMQLRGPYGLWHHTHTFEPIDEGSRTLMTDIVRYGQRFGAAGALAQKLFVERDVERIFDFRRDEIAQRIAGPEAVPA